MHCEICGKHTTFGTKVAHNRMYIANRTSRTYKPNLQRVTVPTEKGPRQITACTRCIRTLKKKQAQ